MLDDLERALDSEISNRGGRLWTWQGDGGLAAFLDEASAEEALQCAHAILNTVAALNRKHFLSRKLQIRIALHLGQARYREQTGRIHSVDINFVSHLEDEFAAPDSLCVSKSLYEKLPLGRKNTLRRVGTFQSVHVYSTRRQVRDRVAVHPDHSSLSPREDALDLHFAKRLRIFSTTGKGCLVEERSRSVIRRKLSSGCSLQVLLLAPDSPYMADREQQERSSFREEQAASVKHIRELQAEFPGAVELRFFRCAPTYQALILDDKRAFVSLPLFGVKGTLGFPCIDVIDGPDTHPLFQKILDSFEALWREAAGYTYRLSAYHDSWISVDPIIHCSHDCKYCVLRIPAWTGRPPRRMYSVAQTVAHLQASKYFRPGKSIIAIGNTTDAFLPQNVQFTVALIRKLCDVDVGNPICIATKCAIPKGALDVLKRLQSRQNLRLIIFLSYSGLPATLEPGVDQSALRASFGTLADAGIPTVHFWRPLVPANATADAARSMLTFVSQHCRSSVAVGLKYTPELAELFRGIADLNLPYSASRPSRGTRFPRQLSEPLWELARQEFPQYPLFRHTSCAVSHVLQIPDYNATQYTDICSHSQCSSAQRAICGGHNPPTFAEVEAAFHMLGLDVRFSVAKDSVCYEGSLYQEDWVFLVHCLGFPLRGVVEPRSNVWPGNIMPGVHDQE
jgi:DNA repair photolyase